MLRFSPMLMQIKRLANWLTRTCSQTLIRTNLIAIAQDNTLQSNIDAVQSDVDGNQTASELADTNMQSDIDQNESDSDSADNTLQSNIDAVSGPMLMETKRLANWLTRTCSQTSIRMNLIAIAQTTRCSPNIDRGSVRC